MATPRINGTLQPVRTKLSQRFDPVRGIVVTQEWESAGDNLGGLALQAKNAGMEYTLDANQYKSRLVMSTTGAAAGFNEQATSTWQLFTNDYQKDILESPAAIALGAGQLAQLRLDFEEIKNGGQDAYDTILSDDYYNDNPNAARLIDYMLAGVTSYEITFYSARASISLPFLYSGEVPGVSPDSLMADLMNDIPVGGPNDGTLFAWGWRRLGTSRTFSGNNRTEISLEWRLGSWAVLFYSDITNLPA